MKESRLILCGNCDDWEQMPNPEIGLCTYDNGSDTTRYDTRCLLGLYEDVEVPSTTKFQISTEANVSLQCEVCNSNKVNIIHQCEKCGSNIDMSNWRDRKTNEKSFT